MNIEIIENENIIERVNNLAQTKLADLHQLIDHKNVGEVRQTGFLLGIEMVEDKQSKTPLADEKLARIIGLCKEKGLIIGKNGDTVPGHNNVIIAAPPLTSTEEDLEFLIDTLQWAIRSL